LNANNVKIASRSGNFSESYGAKQTTLGHPRVENKQRMIEISKSQLSSLPTEPGLLQTASDAPANSQMVIFGIARVCLRLRLSTFNASDEQRC
jgi:hypothetical protein